MGLPPGRRYGQPVGRTEEKSLPLAGTISPVLDISRYDPCRVIRVEPTTNILFI